MVEASAAGQGPLRCGRCGLQGSGPPGDPARPLVRCALCGGGEFYAQKDFNRRLGLSIVVLTALLAFVVMVRAGHLWGLLVLGAVTAADALVYRFLREASVCYLCQSVYRGYPPNADHRAFYLGNEERFKAIRQAWIAGLRP